MELLSHCLMLTMSLKTSDLPCPVAFRRLAISGQGLSLGAAHRDSIRDLVQSYRALDR